MQYEQGIKQIKEKQECFITEKLIYEGNNSIKFVDKWKFSSTKKKKGSQF